MENLVGEPAYWFVLIVGFWLAMKAPFWLGVKIGEKWALKLPSDFAFSQTFVPFFQPALVGLATFEFLFSSLVFLSLGQLRIDLLNLVILPLVPIMTFGAWWIAWMIAEDWAIKNSRELLGV